MSTCSSDKNIRKFVIVSNRAYLYQNKKVPIYVARPDIRLMRSDVRFSI